MALRPLVLLALLAALLLPSTARAGGGNYIFDGGTAFEHAQVGAALQASAFDWGLVPARVTIHIAQSGTRALPGHIWLDRSLVDAGRFAWGPIQHEYAHQVDFFLLGDLDRSWLQGQLGARVWWGGENLGHSAAGAERFASTLAWAYWPSHDNSLRPTAADDEAAALPPSRFRALVSLLLPARMR